MYFLYLYMNQTFMEFYSYFNTYLILLLNIQQYVQATHDKHHILFFLRLVGVYMYIFFFTFFARIYNIYVFT